MKALGYVLAGAVALAVVIGGLLAGRGAAQVGPDGGAPVGPRYSVLQTDGTMLLVTDNATNMTLFYTVDEGGKPGDDLKLRGSIDLSQVGNPVIRVTKAQAGAPAPAPEAAPPAEPETPGAVK